MVYLEKLYTEQWSRTDGVGALIITPTRELAYQVIKEGGCIVNIISYLFGSIVVNLSCKNSHYYTVQEKKFPILFASWRLRMLILTLGV